jgi:L-malate glycosyltransferase
MPLHKNKKIRMLNIETSMALTGGFKSLLNFCLYSKDRIYSVVILKKGSTNKKILEENGIRVYELPLIELSRRPSDIFQYFPLLILNAWRIKRIAKAEKIDILHSNDLYNLSLHVVKYLFCLKSPLIIHVRMMPASFPSFIYKIWRHINIRYADKLIGVSHAIKKAYGNPKKMEVVYNININPEKHPSYEFQYDKKNIFKFIYLANYIKGKGQDHAINAFIKLISRNPNVSLTFVGGDMGMKKNMHYKEELIAQVRKNGLTNKIFFENFASDIELKLKKFNASLNFSYSESFSVVAYDSLRFGVPFISSDCGGPAELFVNGESGFLVKNHSVEEMAEAMYKLSSDTEIGKRFSINSRNYIKEVVMKQQNYDDLKRIFLEYANKK